MSGTRDVHAKIYDPDGFERSGVSSLREANMTGRYDRGGHDAHDAHDEMSPGHAQPPLDDRYYDDPQYASLAYHEARDHQQGDGDDDKAYQYDDGRQASDEDEWTYDEGKQAWVDRQGRAYVEPAEGEEDAYASPYADDEYLAPQEDARLPQRPSRGGVLSLAALVLVASMGGGLAYAWKKGAFVGSDIPGLGGPPPVIRASTDPVKIKPAETTIATQEASPQVFDRKEDTSSPAKEKLVSHDEQPVASVPVKVDTVPVHTASVDAAAAPSAALPSASASDNTASTSTRSVTTSNITLPAPPAGDVAELPTGDAPDGPRRVKTIKIMGDNTVVTGEAPIVAPKLPPSTSRPIDISGITPTAPLTQTDVQAQDPPRIASTDAGQTTSASDNAAAPVQAPTAPASTDKPATADVTATTDDDGGADNAAATTVVVPTRPAETANAPVHPAIPPVRPRNIPAQPAAKPTQVASAEPVASPIVSTGYVVQVSSQKTPADAQAAYQSLQRRFSSVIGGQKATVRKVELGTRGTYYRVRIGLWASSSEAAAFCVKFKAAGGDCVVARN